MRCTFGKCISPCSFQVLGVRRQRRKMRALHEMPQPEGTKRAQGPCPSSLKIHMPKYISHRNHKQCKVLSAPPDLQRETGCSQQALRRTSAICTLTLGFAEPSAATKRGVCRDPQVCSCTNMRNLPRGLSDKQLASATLNEQGLVGITALGAAVNCRPANAVTLAWHSGMK